MKFSTKVCSLCSYMTCSLCSYMTSHGAMCCQQAQQAHWPRPAMLCIIWYPTTDTHDTATTRQKCLFILSDGLRLLCSGQCWMPCRSAMIRYPLWARNVGVGVLKLSLSHTSFFYSFYFLSSWENIKIPPPPPTKHNTPMVKS